MLMNLRPESEFEAWRGKPGSETYRPGERGKAVLKAGWQHGQLQNRKQEPAHKTDHEAIWQQGLGDCLAHRMPAERLQEILDSDTERLNKVAHLVGYHGWLTFVVTRNLAREIGLDPAAERNLWARAWESLYLILRQRQTLDDKWVEVALHEALAGEIDDHLRKAPPVPPEFDSPLAGRLAHSDREWEVLTGRLRGDSVRDMERPGFSKSGVDRTFQTIKRRALNYAHN